MRQYSSRDLLDGNVADDASLKVMLRIEKTMQQLKVMGDDNRRFTLGYGVAGYSDDMIAILGALLDEGIKALSHNTDRLLRMAEETDYVGLTPNPNKYATDDTIGNEIRLPCEHSKDIIKATEWAPQPQVLPIAN